MATERPLNEGVLYTDFYQLTMAQVYFEMGLHERPARFEHFFRSYPDYGAHKAGFCVTAGMGPLLEWMQSVRFGEQELERLRALRDERGDPTFHEPFLEWLAENGHFERLTIEAIPEGRVVHPNVPLTVVTGPLALAQIFETPLLNMLNFATLIATKAARVRESAGDAMIMEFGLRRAQGWAGNSATRSALIGGADFSSNTGESLRLGIEPKGTHAHSLVQAAIATGMSELEAFRHYTNAYPSNALLLVDTIDTLESGVPNAITVFREVRERGYEPAGIRLDSGDLAYLSIESARMLDEAGFEDVSIVLSNSLDELVIWQIESQIRQEASRHNGMDPDRVIRRLVFGVGTNLVTSAGDPALGGVYKLVAIQDGEGVWQPAIKVSETPRKVPIPGVKTVYRVYDQRGIATADLLALEGEALDEERLELRHPYDERRRSMPRAAVTLEPLLRTVFADGKPLDGSASLGTLRQRRRADIARLDPGVRRLLNPHIYHVSLTPALHELKAEVVREVLASSR